MFFFAHTTTPHRQPIATIANITPTASMAAPAPRRDNSTVLCCPAIDVPAIGVPPRQLSKTGKDEDSSSEVTAHIVVEVGHVAGVGAGISSAVFKNACDVVYSR